MEPVLAAPNMQVVSRNATGKPKWAYDLQTAINRARPGDTIQLLPGRYPIPAVMAFGGTADAPITIRGAVQGRSILTGGTTRDFGRHSGMEPMDGDHAVLKLVRANHVILEGLHFEDPWPTAIYLRSCNNVTIRNCHGTGGRYFVFARQSEDVPTHDIMLDGVSWVQDPDHDMWEGRVQWPEVKASRGFYDASYFNGALFGSFDIQGGVTIRNCAVSHAFNAIRMDARDSRFCQTKEGLQVSRNRDVAIYNNSFAFIRDNAIEPEMAAQNWRVFNNRFYNVHAAFSLDGVNSRDLFYLSNTILNDRKPGLPGQESRGGKVFKFLKQPDPNEPLRLRENLCSAFNSILSRTSYAKKGGTQHWLDAYNAVHLFHQDHPDVTEPPRPVMHKMVWNDGIKIMGMATNDTGFPQKYASQGGTVSGFKPLTNLFGVPDYDRNPHDPLGGWTGDLAKTKDLQELRTKKLTLSRRDGPDVVFPSGLCPGAQDLEALGLFCALK